MTKIIAELCQNHNGDIKILQEMVHAAAESGADFAKIQSIDSSDLTHRKKFDDGLIENGEIIYASQEERFSRNKHDSSFPNKAFTASSDTVASITMTAGQFIDGPIGEAKNGSGGFLFYLRT